MALKDNEGNVVSPKRYAQIKLHEALELAVAGLGTSPSLTEKQLAAVVEQGNKLAARVDRVLGFGPKADSDAVETAAESAAE